jgi:hypothetical protein
LGENCGGPAGTVCKKNLECSSTDPAVTGKCKKAAKKAKAGQRCGGRAGKQCERGLTCTPTARDIRKNTGGGICQAGK